MPLQYHCGCADTALVDGAPALSCVTAIEAFAGRRIVTVEGLSDGGRPNAVQQAFIAEGAAQCGYCTNGMIMQSAALLNETPKPDEAAIRQAVHAAGQMAGETVEDVTINLSGGKPRSETIAIEVAVGGHEVGDADLQRVMEKVVPPRRNGRQGSCVAP